MSQQIKRVIESAGEPSHNDLWLDPRGDVPGLKTFRGGKWVGVDNTDLQPIREDISELQGAVNTLSTSKVDKVAGKGLSTNDFTNELKTKYNNAAPSTPGTDGQVISLQSGAPTWVDPTEGSIIDTALSGDSTNPVQNKVITSAISQLGQQVIYDVTKSNPTAGPNNDGKFESLSALLSDDNLSTLIPVAVRCGGMSIRFVQTSDNKYIQYRLMKNQFSTTPSDWQGVDEEPQYRSKNLITSGGVKQIFDLLNDNNVFSKDTVQEGLFICDENGYYVCDIFTILASILSLNIDIEELDDKIDGLEYAAIKDCTGDGLVICDENGYIYIDFSKGIKTKTWNGNYLYPSTNINRGTTDLTGCINKAYDMIHTKWPTAQVFVCSIMKMGRTMADATWSYLRHNNDDLSYIQYNKRIKECAELAGFTFIDLWGEMSIDPLNSEQAPIYFHNAQEIADRGVDPNRINDRLHPIQAGHERIAKVIYNHLVSANGGDSWQGKKAIFFGDSITDNLNGQHTDKVYYSYLTDWLQLKDDGMNPNGYSTKNTVHYPQNAGAYGTGYMLEYAEQGNLYQRIPDYNNDYDLVVIMLGVNDFGCPLGNIYNY